MKQNFILTGILGVGLFLTASATIINIPGDYPTIQQGIDASTDGDTVLVQPGTYVENINFNGHNIVLGSLFLTTGDTSYISMTVIDGDSSGHVINFANDEDSTAVLTGFTIQNGYATVGGGIYVYFCDPIITNNIIIGNIARDDGGGIICRGNDHTPKIIYNMILANTAHYWGGGICLEGTNSTISNNIIYGNSIQWYGGGIYGHYCPNPIITDNIIIGNYAEREGGGLYFWQANPTIINNTISKNTALYGGGICCSSNSHPIITNNIFWADTALAESNEIYVLYNGEPQISFSNIQGGWEGDGNIDIDPLFRDPQNGDFHLMSTECGDPYDSPCIDSGSPAILDSLLDCSWGLGTVLSDMGAHGGGDSTTVGIYDDDVYLPDRLLLKQNYPNPFNATTSLKYSLDQADNVALTIYNILGERVTILFEGFQQAGEHAVVWDAPDYPSGVYFVRLEAGQRSENVKMVLLK